MKYLVLYTSKTGNTKMLADVVYESLPEDGREIKTVEEYTGEEEFDVIFLGFWIDRGNCPMNVADALEKMEDKKVAMFITCGMGGSKEYYDSLKKNLKVWIPDDCKVLDTFICQGKMPESVLQKYESLRGKMEEQKLEQMIENYHTALEHPDEFDLEDAKSFVSYILRSEGENV